MVMQQLGSSCVTARGRQGPEPGQGEIRDVMFGVRNQSEAKCSASMSQRKGRSKGN
jgi:hypothetical protein